MSKEKNFALPGFAWFLLHYGSLLPGWITWAIMPGMSADVFSILPLPRLSKLLRTVAGSGQTVVVIVQCSHPAEHLILMCLG